MHVAKNYSTTRFMSSMTTQFDSIYVSYEALIKVYMAYKQRDDDCEEMQYIVKGRDFIIDLCGIIDVLAPIRDIMVQAQSANLHFWSI